MTDFRRSPIPAHRGRRVMTAMRIALTIAFAPLAGCGLLDVSDPTRVEESEIQNASSANLFRADAIQSVAMALTRNAVLSGLFTDEFFIDPDPSIIFANILVAEEAADRRDSEGLEPLISGDDSPYTRWHATRRSANAALQLVRKYTQEPAKAAYVTQLLAMRGFAELMLAENYCPGFPLNDAVDGHIVYTGPTTTATVFERALADFDSAIAVGTDSARYLNFAKIGKARSLLGLGRMADAGAAVTGIPTEYVYNLDFAISANQTNRLSFSYFAGGNRTGATDHEGGNGLDYVSSHDPRVALTRKGPAYNGLDTIYVPAKYPTREASLVLASGTEARLIEAEAALAAGGDWRGILNTLRRNFSPALPDTTDPGTDVARQNLLFRERAFWLYATGHRLGDLRRLIAHYGRTPESLLPIGPYRITGSYGDGTSLPFPGDRERGENPAITGCTTR